MNYSGQSNNFHFEEDTFSGNAQDINFKFHDRML